jgi:hypothetical protein
MTEPTTAATRRERPAPAIDRRVTGEAADVWFLNPSGGVEPEPELAPSTIAADEAAAAAEDLIAELEDSNALE